MKRLLLPTLAVACAATIFGGLRAGGIVINATPSLPEGFYRKQNRPIEKGCFILFRLPDAKVISRAYARGHLIKQVAAREGDRVSINSSGVLVNGVWLANSIPLPFDREGRPLPQPQLDDYTLGAGELLAMSTFNPRSFDGRYFGVVRCGDVIAVVTPVLTW